MWSYTINKNKLITNPNKINIRILCFFNICGLKVHLSAFLKAPMSQIDLT